jgi:hypothetical protein
MPTTPEAKVKAKVKAALNKHGAYHFSPATGGYGKSGVPDIIACYEGKFIAIECKAGSNKPTALQEANLEAINQHGGFALLINETNIEVVAETLQEIAVWALRRTPTPDQFSKEKNN